MEMEIAVLFIIFIILILWEIKADFVLLIFGFAAYLFLLFYIGVSDPIGSFVSIVEFLIFNWCWEITNSRSRVFTNRK